MFNLFAATKDGKRDFTAETEVAEVYFLNSFPPRTQRLGGELFESLVFFLIFVVNRVIG